MPPSAKYQVKSFLKKNVFPVAVAVGGCWLVLKMVGTPKQIYKEIEQGNVSGKSSEMNYFDKEISRMIQSVHVDGNSSVWYWENMAKERRNADQLKRKKIQELIKEGRGNQSEVLGEFRKMDDGIIQDTLDFNLQDEEEAEKTS